MDLMMSNICQFAYSLCNVTCYIKLPSYSEVHTNLHHKIKDIFCWTHEEKRKTNANLLKITIQKKIPRTFYGRSTTEGTRDTTFPKVPRLTKASAHLLGGYHPRSLRFFWTSPSPRTSSLGTRTPYWELSASRSMRPTADFRSTCIPWNSRHCSRLQALKRPLCPAKDSREGHSWNSSHETPVQDCKDLR